MPRRFPWRAALRPSLRRRLAVGDGMREARVTGEIANRGSASLADTVRTPSGSGVDVDLARQSGRELAVELTGRVGPGRTRRLGLHAGSAGRPAESTRTRVAGAIAGAAGKWRYAIAPERRSAPKLSWPRLEDRLNRFSDAFSSANRGCRAPPLLQDRRGARISDAVGGTKKLTRHPARCRNFGENERYGASRLSRSGRVRGMRADQHARRAALRRRRFNVSPVNQIVDPELVRLVRRIEREQSLPRPFPVFRHVVARSSPTTISALRRIVVLVDAVVDPDGMRDIRMHDLVDVSDLEERRRR